MLKRNPGSDSKPGPRPVRAGTGFPEFSGISAPDLAGLTEVHTRFVSGFTTTLSVYLRNLMSGSLTGIDEMAFARSVDASAVLACSAYFRVPASSSYIMIRFSGGVVACILELLMGASGKFKAELDRPLTEIEQELFEPVFRLIAQELATAWNPAGAIELDLDGFESPQKKFKRIARTEPVAMVRADVTIGESTGHLDVVLPATVARSLCRTDSDSPRAGSPDPSHTGLLLRRLMYNELLLQVQCELRGASLSLRDLMGLRPGTILDLGMPFDSPVTLTANSTPKFTGWIAQEESTMSVTITSLR